MSRTKGDEGEMQSGNCGEVFDDEGANRDMDLSRRDSRNEFALYLIAIYKEGLGS